jgi:hypothetical protein
MQRLIKYKPSNNDAQFLQDCENAGITPAKSMQQTLKVFKTL